MASLDTNRLSDKAFAVPEVQQEQSPLGWWVLGQQRVALRNVKLGVTLVFYVTDSVSLGREGSPNPDVPHIDLEPYDAQNLGVSRLHALLKLEAGTLYIIDQNSANGVRVNQERIRPGIPYALRDWAVIQLGLMSLEIRFPSYRFGTMTSPFSSDN